VEAVVVGILIGSWFIVVAALMHQSQRREGRPEVPPRVGSAPAGVTVVRCAVCRTALAEAVFCERCATPHDAACWRFVGRCATYGCGGRRFVREAAGAGRQTPDEWLAAEVTRDARDSRRSA
jgi:hypothetical protein